METLILPPRYTDDSIAMSKAAAALGWRVERLSSWRVPDWMLGKGGTIYGEPLFATVVAPSLGVELLQPTDRWLPDLPVKYRRRIVRLSNLTGARTGTFPSFVKPVDDKCFIAKVYESKDELPANTVLPDSEIVLISEPVKWESEYRAFVCEGEVKTISPYLRNGELVETEDGNWPADAKEMTAARAFCMSVLLDDAVQCPPAFVLDVGVIAGLGWAVIEANPAWGCGIYGCEHGEVLNVVRRSCVQPGLVTAVDRLWARRNRDWHWGAN